MNSPWTPERRARQAEAIKKWQPWLRSTGPRSKSGKARSATNAWKGGHRRMMRDDVREIRGLLKELSDPVTTARL
ncbi:hypothetical protein FZC33_20790 [Labrys sp. KNU-23]|nr:hypothetical protein FZC33_20790 [Labrys sp. KNU-23]